MIKNKYKNPYRRTKGLGTCRHIRKVLLWVNTGGYSVLLCDCIFSRFHNKKCNFVRNNVMQKYYEQD
jgi:hypothetical protein